MSETVKFTIMFDRFFDCLNVNNFTTGKHKRKPFQNPYRSPDDFRLKVCLHAKNMHTCACTCNSVHVCIYI